MEELIAQMQSLYRGGWKYRWYAITIAWIVSVIGFTIVYRMPDNFQASARVYVDSQSVLRPLLAGMTTVPNIDQQVSIMSRTLLSRPNVERVIRMVDLDIKANSPKDREKQVEEVTSKIKIGGTAQNDIYSLIYNDENPKLAKDVVQALLTIFVEGSFGDKRQDTTKALVFIDSQIKNYEEKLIAAENALKEFKLRNMNLLSGTGDSGSKFSSMQDSLNQARLDLAEAVNARDAIKRDLQAGTESAARPSDAAQSSNPEIDDRIQAINKNIDSLRLQFTDEHPDIVAAKRLIAQLKARKMEDAKVRKPDSEIVTAHPVLQQMKIALSAAEAKVAAMRARVDEYAARSSKLNALSTAAPEIESQLAQLNRDYGINKENYTKLLASREQAKLSGELNTSTEMVTFRVIDPPIVPLAPVGPARIRLFSMVFVAALAAGVVSAVLLSMLRPTFLSHMELMEVTGFPVLGSVSMKWTDAEVTRQRKSTYAFIFSGLVLLMFYAALLSLMYFK